MAAPAAITGVSGTVRVGKLRQFAWRHPEWWALAFSCCAWSVVVVKAFDPHAHHAEMGAGWLARTVHWQWMTMAMMLPLMLEQARTIAARSFWRRRNWAIAEFVAGYLVLWALAGVVVSMVPSFGEAAWVGAFVVAAAWQLTSMKRRALLTCHRTMPLAPYGWAARRDCLIHGWSTGMRCFVSCWALMLACAMSGHGLFAAIGLSAVSIAERYQRRPDQRLLALAVLAIGLLTWLVPATLS